MSDTGRGEKRSILIIDDDPQALGYFATILERGGYAVVTETSGYKALEIIANEKPDLIVLDLNMPEPDGFEMLSFLRANAPGQRILVVSGMGGVLLDAADLLGATSVLDKVDAPRKLVETVNRLLK